MTWYQHFKLAAKLTPIEFEGTLKNKNGFIYLDIPNQIITGFLSLIKGKVEHPREASDNYPGAHISVMQEDEADKKITEIGKKFKFTLTGADQTKPDGWDGVNKVYFITVDAPELEDLREKYGLSRKNKGHDFHITLGVKLEKSAAIFKLAYDDSYGFWCSSDGNMHDANKGHLNALIGLNMGVVINVNESKDIFREVNGITYGWWATYENAFKNGWVRVVTNGRERALQAKGPINSLQQRAIYDLMKEKHAYQVAVDAPWFKGYVDLDDLPNVLAGKQKRQRLGDDIPGMLAPMAQNKKKPVKIAVI